MRIGPPCLVDSYSLPVPPPDVRPLRHVHSEITAEGKRVTKLDQILLNGNNVAVLVPGGSGPES